MPQIPLKDALLQGTLDGTPTGGTVNLSNVSLTFTAPKFTDLGFIGDANGNELIIFDTVASAVNEVTFANAATGSNPTFTASGADTNVGFTFAGKGTGTFRFTCQSSATAGMMTALMPSLASGNGAYFSLGKAESNYDLASFGFVFSSTGSTNNYLAMALYGQAPTTRVYATEFTPGSNAVINLGNSSLGWKQLFLDKTITAGGTTGARTINKSAGSVNFAAASTSLVVTNNLVTTSSVIICTVGTNDATLKSVSAVAAAGSFTMHANAAATAETRVNFIVIN